MIIMVDGEGFEPSKAEPTDLQSVPFDRSGTHPRISGATCRGRTDDNPLTRRALYQLS